ncbi:hypothetical protein EZS27_020695 [termite gut metagenome]|uniref:THIF-type NAD/FAD binding fold domain-containing protein n=1 Tax=termite gut metagenome TaxID=433724 RepID=A0A5J4RA87_9ZZZZ
MVDKLKKHIAEIPFVSKINFLEQRDFFIIGNVEIGFDELREPLSFDVQIAPSYPFKSQGSETIRFLNNELLMYNHVMEDGSICIHTLHNTDIKEKLKIDFLSLKNWIIKYYINKENDINYEHIIVNIEPIENCYYSYIFSNVDYFFKKGDFGTVNISSLNRGVYKEKLILNYLVQKFDSYQTHKQIDIQWSNLYKSLPLDYLGAFYFTENIPAKYGRFAFSNWLDLEPYLSKDFLEFLYHFGQKNSKEDKDRIMPLFLGYKISDTEVYWQVTMIKVGKLPIEGIPKKVNGIKTGLWESKLIDKKIDWVLTHDASYKYFFGRGTLCEHLTNAKILIIGIGAVGSMLAKGLAKGGCQSIGIIDYDVKEPENVCRSEYEFNTGIVDKVYELSQILMKTSPFVNVKPLDHHYFEQITKIWIKEKGAKEAFSKFLNEYDLIFDCSTDNDLMYILDALELSCDIINLSITNHANDLVCAFYPNIYHFVSTQFEAILNNDVTDLYNPIGCWNPTFKASYNDINLLVQMALKQINIVYQQNKVKNNFIIRTNENVCNLKIEEY